METVLLTREGHLNPSKIPIKSSNSNHLKSRTQGMASQILQVYSINLVAILEVILEVQNSNIKNNKRILSNKDKLLNNNRTLIRKILSHKKLSSNLKLKNKYLLIFSERIMINKTMTRMKIISTITTSLPLVMPGMLLTINSQLKARQIFSNKNLSQVSHLGQCLKRRRKMILISLIQKI